MIHLLQMDLQQLRRDCLLCVICLRSYIRNNPDYYAFFPDQLDRVDAVSVIQLKKDVTDVESALQTLRMIKVDIVCEMTT